MLDFDCVPIRDAGLGSLDDPVTVLTYVVFYESDYDAGQAVVAYALLEGKKVRLNRGLRQRMEQVAYDKWLAEAIEDSAEEIASREFRVPLLSAKPPTANGRGGRCPARAGKRVVP